jgi:leucyl-tRNA synthetase
MFFARWDMGAPWNSSNIEGTVRWIRRVWALLTEPGPTTAKGDPNVERQLRRKLHQSLKRVTRDYETFEFNTIVSTLMELLNDMYKAQDTRQVSAGVWDEAMDIYLRMMAPSHHITEELWTGWKPYSIRRNLA